MRTVKTKYELQQALQNADRTSIGFVPTMGALHAGHISLVKAARERNATVVVSIFVNPTQFNDPADLEKYPRNPEGDLSLLEKAGADIVFMPEVAEIYPEPDDRLFDFGRLDKVMEGATRPGHFNGVAQVVSRLFELVAPQRAYFGEKDYQQVAIVRELVRQTGSGVEIISCPTLREPDGLAMSSRNVLISPQLRPQVPIIYRALREGAELVGEKTPGEVEQYVKTRIGSAFGLEVIYFKLVDGTTLQEVSGWDSPAGVRGCVAVRAGDVRLIDNMRFV